MEPSVDITPKREKLGWAEQQCYPLEVRWRGIVADEGPLYLHGNMDGKARMQG